MDDSTNDEVFDPSAETGAWNARQERVAVLLASGSTIRDAASEVGVGERTIHTWLDEPSYRAFVGSIRDRVLGAAVGRLTDATTRAASVLAELLDAESENVRLRAALGVFDTMIKARTFGELVDRLEVLERRAASNPGRM